MSLYVGKLVDNVLPGGNLNLLNLLGVAMILIIVIRLLLKRLPACFFVGYDGVRGTAIQAGAAALAEFGNDTVCPSVSGRQDRLEPAGAGAEGAA